MADRRLPDSAYNGITAGGAVLAGLSFLLILLLLLIDAMAQETTVYLGLVTFVVLPAFLVLGLILIPLGMLQERRRLAQGEASSFYQRFHINPDDPGHRNAVLIFAVGTVIFLVGSSVGSYKAYKQTESEQFCGTLCHSVMSPEYTAFQESPHARVGCAECHIGEGADWYVKSKLSGAYQVYATLVDNYPRPIPTPIENLRPARETCEHCHWPEHFFGARLDVNEHFLSDEENTHYPISMLIDIGGGSEESGRVEGIHWHVSKANKVEYIARDRRREDIAWVRLSDGRGRVLEFENPDEPLEEGERAAAEVRTMDCIDCHNRPSHNYRSPNRTVNQALASGAIDRNLPYIKQQAVTVLDETYEDTVSALRAIEEGLIGFYEEEYPELLTEQKGKIDAAVVAVQSIYQQNFFPRMKVTWREYPDHIGHSEFIGCFRCHGSELQTAEGEGISKDCNLCHQILAQGTGEGEARIAPQGLAFAHPEDIGGEEFESNCTECHEGGAEIF